MDSTDVHVRGRAQRCTATAALALVALLALTGCVVAGSQPAAPASRAPQPTFAPLPAFGAGQGYRTVLTLGNASQQRPSGSFVASAPYYMVFECEGNGYLVVSYRDIVERTTCNGTPSPNGTQIWPATNAAVQVAGNSGGGRVQWTLFVEMQS